MKARIGIFKVSSNKEPYTFMSLDIEDDSTGLPIIRIQISMEQYASIITNSGGIGDITNIIMPEDMDYLGKTKEIKTISLDDKFIDRVYDKSKQRELIGKQVNKEKLLVDGWKMWSDGTSSQQNITGKHNVVLYRYV